MSKQKPHTMSEAARQARNAYQRDWCSRNREKVQAYRRKWRTENQEHIREYIIEYWERRAAEENRKETADHDDR